MFVCACVFLLLMMCRVIWILYSSLGRAVRALSDGEKLRTRE